MLYPGASGTASFIRITSSGIVWHVHQLSYEGPTFELKSNLNLIMTPLANAKSVKAKHDPIRVSMPCTRAGHKRNIAI